MNNLVIDIWDIKDNDIKKIEETKKTIEQTFKKSMGALAKESVKIINRNANELVKGFEQQGALQNEYRKERETKYSITYDIYNTTNDATFAEFGTGIVGGFNEYKHPHLSWEYDVNNHGGKGWFFTRENTNNDLTWVSKRGEETYHTFGIASQPFYFVSGEEIEDVAIDFIMKQLKKGGL